MKTIRENVFETNSSSTHTLVYSETANVDGYVPKSDKVIVNFIDTNDEHILYSLRDKVSYLVSHIINTYKWDCESYEDLKEQVERCYDFQRIAEHVKQTYGKEVVLPKTYSGYLEDIVSINHQLYNSNLDGVLEDLVEHNFDYLAEVLAPNQVIEIGHD